ncbi:hypothetical protein RHMOL_Rhmol11G0132700 [Rhododendron molle]|uniref:Uncharacterized protein n=1 Tax=Rhododendron molle TaxID=49168 RepID=A0ACC0LRW0_RHOML|nr:hypothetical protein RHMOL_Rhmol11G0132700 [Rhododendron molle]
MGSFNWEYFDFMNDDRLARRWKRKCVRNKELKFNCFSQSLKGALEDQKLGGGMVDEDYLSFFNHVVKDMESRNSMVKDDDESGEDDPHYKMFLEKLKEDGKSYVLQVAGKNEVSLYIKYEAEDSSDDELQPPGIRKSRIVMDTESLEAAKDLRLETQKNWTNTGRVYMMDWVGSETTYSVVERDMTPEPVNHVFGKENGFSSDNPCPKDSHFEIGSEHETAVEMVDECYQIYLNGIKGKADSTVPSIEDTEVEMVDECYQIYLNGIKGKADSTVPTIEDTELVKDEKMDDRSSSESEVLVALNASDFGEGNYSPFETPKLYVTWVEEDGLQCLGNPKTSFHSRYREKLMEKLSESYDHEEYDKLWRDITEERPKERHFHLRSGIVKSGKKYGVPGPSYLDQYPGGFLSLVSSSWDFTEDFDFTQSKWRDAVDVGWRPQELKVIVLGLLSGGFTFKYSSTADHNCGVGVWWGELESEFGSGRCIHSMVRPPVFGSDAKKFRVRHCIC